MIHGRFSVLLIAVAAAILLISCNRGGEGSLHRSSRFLLGTLVQVTVKGSPEKAAAATEALFNEMVRVEKLTSFHQPSGLNRVNDAAGKGPVKPGPELLALVGKSLDMAEKTKGAFDPTVGALTRLWNFSGTGEARLPEPPEIEEALKKVGWTRVKLEREAGTIELPEPGMALDLGGIGKGYSLDRALVVLREHGITAALVNAGGDIVVLGDKEPGKPWRVGIQDPRDQNGVIAVAEVHSGFVATSGDYERFFLRDGKRYHHILDPSTGYPAGGLESVTIIGPEGVSTQPTATSVFVLGVERGLRYVAGIPGLEALLVDSEGKIHTSPGVKSFVEIKR